MVVILAMPATVHWKSRYDVEMDSKKLICNDLCQEGSKRYLPRFALSSVAVIDIQSASLYCLKNNKNGRLRQENRTKDCD